MQVHIITTNTDWTAKQNYLIDESRYETYRQEYLKGQDLPHIEQGLEQGWIIPADENGNPK